jgi:hypothetical protein
VSVEVEDLGEPAEALVGARTAKVGEERLHLRLPARVDLTFAENIFTSVDLPAPFSPTSACVSPPYRSMDASATAWTAPNALAA